MAIRLCSLPRTMNKVCSSFSNYIRHSLGMSTRHKWLRKPFSPNTSPARWEILTMTEASTTLNPWTFLTVRSGSTTPQFAPLGDIEAVPTRWSPIVAIFLTMLSISASVVTFVNGAATPEIMLRKTGAPENVIASLTASRTAAISNSVVRIAGSILGSSNGLFDPMVRVPPEKLFGFCERCTRNLMWNDSRDEGLTKRMNIL